MQTIAFVAGSVLFLLIGVGHTLLYLRHRRRAGKAAAIAALRQTEVKIMGDTVTLYSLYEGYSLMMGGLLIAYGALNLLLLAADVADLKPVIGFDILVTTASAVMFRQYAFFLPVTLAVLAALAYAIALIV